jgi:DNA-binding MarR family transcriptional regulator
VGAQVDGELADALETVIFRLICGQAAADMDMIAAADLSMSQLRCLLAVAAEDRAVPIHTLAERLGLTLATAGRAVDRLVAHGLVTRREDPEDRRVRRIALSPKGRRVITGIDESRRRALLAFVRSLSAAHAAQLLAALRPIAATATGTRSDLEEQIV